MADWRLIYATDGTGAVTSGSFAELFHAAINGGDIKVRYSPQSGTWWVRYCQSVTVRGKSGEGVVAATYSDAINTSAGPGEVVIDGPLTLEYHVYNSSGLRSFAKRNPVTGQVQTEERVMPMAWYARDYPLSLLERLIVILLPRRNWTGGG